MTVMTVMRAKRAKNVINRQETKDQYSRTRPPRLQRKIAFSGRLGFGQQSVVLIPPSFESSLKPYKTEKDQFELILFGFRGERTRIDNLIIYTLIN